MARRLDILAVQEFGGNTGKVLVHLGYLYAADGKHEGRYAIEQTYEQLNEESLDALRALWQQRAEFVDALEAKNAPKLVTPSGGLSLVKH